MHVTVFLIIPAKQIIAQGTRVDFGKNVVQYKDFDWYVYETENFDIYYYTGGKELAKFVVENGPKYLREIERKLDFPVSERIVLIIYNSYNDFRQSNFRADEDPYALTGKSRVVGNKVFLYFDGNHFNLASQVRAGIMHVAFHEMLNGGNIQERFQNNMLLNMPAWYLQGLVDFYSEGWSAEKQSRLSEGIRNGKFMKFRKLPEEDQVLVANSLWKYLNDTYGEATIGSMLYIMRSSKSIESSYLFVLGKSFNDVFNEWYNFHRNAVNTEKTDAAPGEELPLEEVFNKGKVLRWDISMRGQYAALVTLDQGITRLWVMNITTGEKKIIYKTGYKRAGEVFDENYPVIGWSPRQNILTVFFEKKSLPYFFTYNADDDKAEPPLLVTRIERVLSFDYAENGRTLILSAIHLGQSDLMIFDIKSFVLRPVTNDVYDDLLPRFTNDSRGIVFQSNRPAKIPERKRGSETDYTLNENFDIFYLPDYTNVKVIKQLSNSAHDEVMPEVFDTVYFSYITSENGINNINAVDYDSIFSHIRLTILFKDTSLTVHDTMYFYRNDLTLLNYDTAVLSNTNFLRADTLVVYKDTFYTYTLTNYDRNLISYRISREQGLIYLLFHSDGDYHLYRSRTPRDIPSESLKSARKTYFLPSTSSPGPAISSELSPAPPIYPAHTDSLRPIAESYFQTDFPVPAITYDDEGLPVFVTSPGKQKTDRARIAAPAIYNLSFTQEFVLASFDNSIINSPYLPYSPGESGPVSNPALAGMYKIGTSDLFKDYRITGGVRLQPTLRGAEYFIVYDNLRKRMDKQLLFFRRGELKDNLYNNYRQTSHELRGTLRWPFSETFAVKLGAFGRVDKKTWMAEDVKTLRQPGTAQYWTGLRNEWVYDNSMAYSLNLYSGWKAKFYTDVFGSLSERNTFFAVTGADLRKSIKLTRHLFWVNRLAAGTSFGSARVVYFLGGVDNWLYPLYDSRVLVDPSQNYV
ncbi:MAG: hypothetical protein M3Q97_08750, partial [Bacteroidota bacterium]|nr:hypothetical protein [Bacteroidota bacterium]